MRVKVGIAYGVLYSNGMHLQWRLRAIDSETIVEFSNALYAKFVLRRQLKSYC